MPEIQFSAPAIEFNGLCTVKAQGEPGISPLSPTNNCEICVKPKLDLFTPTSTCFDFLDDGVQLPRQVVFELTGMTGPQISQFSDSIATTYQGNAGTLYREAYVQGPSPQSYGNRVLYSARIDLLFPTSSCRRLFNYEPDVLLTIDSGWWQNFGFREWLPTSDTVNINTFTLELESWPDGAQTSEERIVARHEAFFEISLDSITGLLTCKFSCGFDASNPGNVVAAGPHGNAYVTNAFQRTSDGARIVVAQADEQVPAGFDAATEDVPDFEIEGFIQINADGTWEQTSTVNTTGGSGSMNLWLA